eukprot:gb/GEZN01016901.1/.p1 GENE.gb/GEZN01016901.1/~~gb/GEZN01016901.1/.p1  ORF type:complete len:177 (-),score=20.99 gb/GEZN01016901.1/:71-601(-)
MDSKSELKEKDRNATVANAKDYIFGYTGANDVSARHWQNNAGSGQWIRGKMFDTFLPLGPSMVTADDIKPMNLKITTTLNGKVKQDSTTADMIFDVYSIVAWLSTDTTLLPGTIIITGTPGGVGAPQNLWMKPGDKVEVWIEGIGKLANTIQLAPRERTTKLAYVEDGQPSLVSKL